MKLSRDLWRLRMVFIKIKDGHKELIDMVDRFSMAKSKEWSSRPTLSYIDDRPCMQVHLLVGEQRTESRQVRLDHMRYAMGGQARRVTTTREIESACGQKKSSCNRLDITRLAGRAERTIASQHAVAVPLRTILGHAIPAMVECRCRRSSTSILARTGTPLIRV